MGLTLANLRSSTRKALGVESTDTGWGDTEIDLLLNTSWWELQDVFSFREAEIDRTFNTVAGTASYATATGHNNTQVLSIEDDDSSQHTLLNPISEIEYESVFVDTTAARGKPTRYMRRGSSIILWPTPDDVYEIKEYYIKTLDDIASGGPTIPQAWHELIWLGAAFRGFLELGDVNKAYAYRRLQGLPSVTETKQETKAKEKQDVQFAAVQLLRPRYP
jgi:hypothetical protein